MDGYSYILVGKGQQPRTAGWDENAIYNKSFVRFSRITPQSLGLEFRLRRTVSTMDTIQVTDSHGSKVLLLTTQRFRSIFPRQSNHQSLREQRQAPQTGKLISIFPLKPAPWCMLPSPLQASHTENSDNIEKVRNSGHWWDEC